MTDGNIAVPPPIAPMRFSTDWFSARDRLGIWREEFGQKIVRLDMEPLTDEPLHYDATFLSVGDASIGKGRISAISCDRTKALLDDGNDNIILLMPEDTVLRAEQGRFDETLGAGDCFVRRSSEEGRTRSQAGRFWTVNLPVAPLAERVHDIDRLLATVVPAQTDALHFLIGYCRMVLAREHPIAPATATAINEHLLDLAALAIGANRDAWHVARDRGLREARRHEIRAAIRRNAPDPDYRIADLARAMRVSESYIRKLLSEDGTTFSALLLAARLELAQQKLADPGRAALQIGRIALDCGFGDISYFNRTFHRHFAMTPSEMRRMGRDEAEG